MEDAINRIMHSMPSSEKGERFVIGIDGLSRSGKTTFAAKLVEHYNKNEKPAICFHLDDFIVERSRRYGTGQAEWLEYYSLQWEADWLKEHFFRQLKHAAELELPFYDAEQDVQRMKKIALPSSCVIVVEGVFLQRPEWRGCCDWVIYVDSPRQSRMEREAETVQRNRKKFESRYWPAEEYYISTEEPQKKADFIVQN